MLPHTIIDGEKLIFSLSQPIYVYHFPLHAIKFFYSDKRGKEMRISSDMHIIYWHHVSSTITYDQLRKLTTNQCVSHEQYSLAFSNIHSWNFRNIFKLQHINPKTKRICTGMRKMDCEYLILIILINFIYEFPVLKEWFSVTGSCILLIQYLMCDQISLLSLNFFLSFFPHFSYRYIRWVKWFQDYIEWDALECGRMLCKVTRNKT